MGGKASREKGARFERDLAKILTRAGFPSSRNARNGISTDDIAHSLPGVHLEAKHCERLEIPKWWAQCVRDAEDRAPVLVFKQNRAGERVITTLEHYLDLQSRVVQLAAQLAQMSIKAELIDDSNDVRAEMYFDGEK